MKKKIFLSLTFIFSAWQTEPFQLTNQLLKAADSAGLFDRAIIDILLVRQKIRRLPSQYRF